MFLVSLASGGNTCGWFTLVKTVHSLCFFFFTGAAMPFSVFFRSSFFSSAVSTVLFIVVAFASLSFAAEWF